MIDINIDSTSLGSSSCILSFRRTVIGDLANGVPDGKGAYRSLPAASAMYGIAVHKFIDVMYKTGGHYPTARVEAERVFNLPKCPPKDKQEHLSDPKHLITTCYNLWTQKIEEDSEFEIIQIPTECYWCKGSGMIKENDSSNVCIHCKGQKIVQGPATEITFRILLYKDAFVRIWLCGTIDSIGQFVRGCFAIRDWKSTSSWQRNYLEQYEMSRQLRVYTLACKLEAKNNPTSILGRIGATRMGAFIDAVFIKSKPNENVYERSQVFQFGTDEIEEFHSDLLKFCERFSKHIQANYFPKEGILNGTCSNQYGKCKFWDVCKNNKQVAEILLNREFERKPYNPLAFNE